MMIFSHGFYKTGFSIITTITIIVPLASRPPQIFLGCPVITLGGCYALLNCVPQIPMLKS